MKTTSQHKLSKCCIKEMVENPTHTTKPYLVQIFQIRSKGSPESPQSIMLLSDGVYNIRAAYNKPGSLHEFDVIAVSNWAAPKIKNMNVVIIKEMTLVYTDLKEVIGKPVDYEKENEAVLDVDPVIPQTATLIDKSFLPEEEAMDQDSELMDAILATEEAVEKSPEESKKAKPQKVAERIEEIPGLRPVKSLGSYSTDWTIKVRLTSKGKRKTFNKRFDNTPSVLLPLEFIDEEGTQITATIFGSAVDKFEPILESGKCYYVSKGMVKFANKRYTSIANDHTITLDETSTIKPAPDDSSIKAAGFNFVPIDKIKDYDNKSLVDVIGIVNEVGTISKITRENQEIAMRTVTVYDESKDSIRITFWREFADKEITDKQIIGLKNLSVGEFGNRKQLNTTTNTVMLTNPEDKRLPLLKFMVEKNIAPVKSVSKSKEPLSMIAEITNPGELTGKYYTISGEIVSVNYEKTFYYVACAGCNKKMQAEKCQFCDEDKGTKITYVFSIQVSDGTASTFVYVFGEAGEQLLGKPAEDVKTLKEQSVPEHKAVFDAIKGKVTFIKMKAK